MSYPATAALVRANGDGHASKLLTKDEMKVIVEHGVEAGGRLVEERARLAKLCPAKLYTAGELEDEFPELDEAVIEGLLRMGETMNIVSVSKIGKSWLLLDTSCCIVTGRPWLGRFACRKGLALLVDNELKSRS